MTDNPAGLTAFDRSAMSSRLPAMADVVVVGGGITGAGVALDAAARGLSVVLVEANDFASGTSSKSSKLIHGGLRYLQQREYRLVYEALAERQRLIVNAPHLVTPLPFLIPLFGKDGVVNAGLAKAYSGALWMYDLTGGLRIGRRHRRLDLADARAAFPDLRSDRLVAGFLYWDARADDARLTLAVIRTAVLGHGALALNYAPVEAVLHDGQGRAAGVRVTGTGDIGARVVVNAGGVWADRIGALPSAPADPGAGGAGDPDAGGAGGTAPHREHSLRPAKGIHITIPGDRLRCTMAAVLNVPGDRRSIFVVPWADRVYVGTTDTDYTGPLDEPTCTPEDIDYLLQAVNAAVTTRLDRSDIVGTWAGLRPLVAGAATDRTADLSRRHRVTTASDGVITVTGGKLTTYRRMASDTVDEVVGRLGHGARRSPTARLPLWGAPPAGSVPGRRRPARDDTRAGSGPGADDGLRRHLHGRYGTEARTVLTMIDADPSLGQRLVPGLPYRRAEAVYAVRYEMALTLSDVLARRTRAVLLDDRATAAAAAEVADLIGPELGWSSGRTASEVERFRADLAAERAGAGLPGAGLPGAAPAGAGPGAPEDQPPSMVPSSGTAADRTPR